MKNAIHMLQSVKGSQMNSFIIETAEGGVIVIDGGYRSDAEKLLSHLRAVTGCDVPHIDAWFLSHVHLDHIEAFMELYEKHYSEFSCDAVYYNFPSVQFTERYEKGEAHTNAEFTALLPKFASVARVVSESDSYEIKGARFDILYTPDPAFKGNAINNSSVVFKMTLGGKTCMFLGDLGIEAGNRLLAEHRAELKSDLVQMAHHGQNGVTYEVYEAIAPEGCFWCTPRWLWENDAGRGYNTHVFKTIEVRGWMEKLGVKNNYVSMDGDITLDL